MNSLEVQLGLCSFSAKGKGLIPGCGTKIPHCMAKGRWLLGEVNKLIAKVPKEVKISVTPNRKIYYCSKVGVASFSYEEPESKAQDGLYRLDGLGHNYLILLLQCENCYR